ncbi:cyclophilin-like fold protein [Pantoea dispersa]|uniref:cyclophilin-like fold protein n=1 Tax=Pantoea dispersa TaxID=59814 RepID=UPI0023A96666|nr:cyclophilin-like fold protein [Pantoea dispersa]WEA05737.1 cyclophilin-like fold protein [Pantoea dispersa]
MKPVCDNAFSTSPSVQKGRKMSLTAGLIRAYTLILFFTACPVKDAALSQPEPGSLVSHYETSPGTENTTMWMTADGHRFAITLDDNEAARALSAMLPFLLNMEDLNSNEKFAELDKPLPVNSVRPGLIENGDVMLYGNRTVVVFYETFHSSYSYTRLGRISDPSGLAQVLGQGAVQIKFSAR